MPIPRTTAIPHRPCELQIGRAGSGKTYGCLRAITRELKTSARGEPLILLCPEQASAQMERRLITWPGVEGFTRARVFSFNHLAREAFKATGLTPSEMLGESGRVMLIRRALRESREELLIFKHSVGQAGVAESLSGTLQEFQRYGWTAQDLKAWYDEAPDEERIRTLLGQKIHDLLLLWRRFEAMLEAEGWQDSSNWLTLASVAIRQWDALAGARVWVDGFASFTVQELNLLDALLSHATEATVALCADPRIIDADKRPSRIMTGPERLFENVEKTYHQLKERLEEAGWAVRATRLPEDKQPTRFEQAPALAHLEARVLTRLNPVPFGGECGESIELIEAADRRAELEAVARRIVALCRVRKDSSGPEADEPAMTWRDIAVLTRSLEPYESLVREVFGQFGIPFFLDRPRTINGHSLPRLMLSSLEVIRSGFRGDAIRRYLKCGLTGVEELDVLDMLENMILAEDPVGSGWREQIEGTQQGVQDAWKKIEAPLRELEKGLRENRRPAEAIWEFIQCLNTDQTLERWIEEARERGDEEAAQLHEQAWAQAIDWLDELHRLWGDGAKNKETPQRPEGLLDELIEALEAALASTSARLIPPTLNQVTVGAVDRSRTPEIKVLFVLGMNELEFPRQWTPDPILGDEERERVARHGRPLGPDSQVRRLQEHYLAYIALTRASERLVLSRPLITEEGKATESSHYFRTVAEAFELHPTQAARAGRGEMASPARAEEWALHLGQAINTYRLTGQGERLGELMRLGDPLSHDEIDPRQRELMLEARRFALTPETPALSREWAKLYWDQCDHFRVTALEQYGACPYKFFASQMLELNEREEAQLNVMELGTIRHDLLEHLFEKLRGPKGLAWGELDVRRADQVIDERLAHLSEDPRYERRLRHSGVQRMVVEGIGREMKWFSRALKFAGERGRTRQISAEWAFRGERALRVEADGRWVAISGKVDRVDQSKDGRTIFLFDYKSGNRTIDLATMLEGIDLQLLTYGLAYRRAELDETQHIGGVFYWPLSTPTLDAEKPDRNAAETSEPLQVDAKWFEERMPQGLFAEDAVDELDAHVAPQTSSAVFHFSRKKDGTLTKYSSHWPPEDFARLFEYTEFILRRMLEGIAGGRIEPHPYRKGFRDACQGCAYDTVCRINARQVETRVVASQKREEVIELLQESIGEVSR